MALKPLHIPAEVKDLVEARLREQDRHKQRGKDEREMIRYLGELHFFPVRFLAMIASISSGSLGTLRVRLRLPSSVTRTSSSMRMPIPRYFAGASLASG